MRKKKVNPIFQDFAEMFEQLIESVTIETDDLPVISLIVSNKHDRAIIVTEVTKHESQVR